MTTNITALSLRTTAVTDYHWINLAATTMADDTIQSVETARAENLRAIHASLAVPPPTLLESEPREAEWKEPEDQTKITINEVIVKQNLETGAALEERPLEPYVTTYRSLNPEEN